MKILDFFLSKFLIRFQNQSINFRGAFYLKKPQPKPGKTILIFFMFFSSIFKLFFQTTQKKALPRNTKKINYKNIQNKI
jgi:hypothetical protein